MLSEAGALLLGATWCAAGVAALVFYALTNASIFLVGAGIAGVLALLMGATVLMAIRK